MTVKEAHIRWNISESTVRKYCREGVIPDAYKETKAIKNLIHEEWNIPDISKPPAGRSRLVGFLKRIIVINEGAEPKISNTDETVRNIYDYLSDYGFTTKITLGDDIVDSLKSVRLTSEGIRLIRMEYPEITINSEMVVTAGISKGPIQASISHTKSKTQKSN